jgi:hypothetical protein|tara:strand:- start:228 stop:413 length:186 start_codon:yes stop_codon:yes gene_type:complete
MNITSAQWVKNLQEPSEEPLSIAITIDGNEEVFVPKDPDNRHYAEILRQVKEGTLTIKDAD